MNTPAHAVLNLALLTTGARRGAYGAALAGAVLPDLPILGFYLWQRIVAGLGEQQIWSEAYFRAPWQAFFDVFNSIPLALAGLVVAVAFRHETSVVLVAILYVAGYPAIYLALP